jgi:sodium-dependent dicarboxylate transporter 2/3/5
MAFVAGAGSIITLLGAARGAVAIGFYREIVPHGEISFFQLTYYMLPVGVLMTFLLWLYCLVLFKPEKKTIPGLRARANLLYEKLGPITRTEVLALVIILTAIAVMSSRQFVPEVVGRHLHKSAVILTATILFFVFRILTLEDLEKIPWNIILLFGGAMSIGFCLWETGAAEWMAIQWLVLFEGAPWLVFVMGTTLFVLVMTNLIMNVAAIAISLPVALVLAPYLGVTPEVILFSALVAAGMPFLLLVGAAPNAIAYESKQFTSGQFFLAGVPASALLMVVITVFVWLIWPLMGMQVLVQ